jgi:hypothetical protein
MTGTRRKTTVEDFQAMNLEAQTVSSFSKEKIYREQMKGSQK